MASATLSSVDHEASYGRVSEFSLALGSLGVVYGDIGTSPLYALKEAVKAAGTGGQVQPEAVIGVASLMLWTLLLIVTVKYVLILLRADNHGEGGIFALMSVGQLAVPRSANVILMIGIAGAAFFYGDCVITPAISVLSAIEGLQLVHPGFDKAVLPLSAIILIALFAVQSRGTDKVGRWFGPIMTVWFVVLAAGGIPHIITTPSVLLAFNPLNGIYFLGSHGLASVFVLGAVFLTVTGAEALYADLGHFGRRPIQIAWMGVVLPALAINYLGQSALLINTPSAIENPFFRLYPEWALIPMVLLATMATVIASQAVITGAFSLTRQAVQFGLLPRLSVQHTSASMAGQIYMPRVNLALLIGVLLVVGGFRSSDALASAYGISVTATMVLTTMIAYLVIWRVWKWPLWQVSIVIVPLLLLEQAFFFANAAKILEGGWLPLLTAVIVFIVMTSWRRGSAVLAKITRKNEAELDWLARKLEAKLPHRVPGTAVFLTADPTLAPTALLHNLKHNHILHERNIVLSMRVEPMPRVPSADRLEINRITDHFIVIVARYGFMETPNVPQLLEKCKRKSLNIDISQASFFVSRRKLKATMRSQLPRWQERLFIGLSGVAEDATAYFQIPPDRVVEVGTQVMI